MEKEINIYVKSYDDIDEAFRSLFRTKDWVTIVSPDGKEG